MLNHQSPKDIFISLYLAYPLTGIIGLSSYCLWTVYLLSPIHTGKQTGSKPILFLVLNSASTICPAPYLKITFHFLKGTCNRYSKLHTISSSRSPAEISNLAKS